MKFRQKALTKLHSPEELDVPVRFARPQGWLVLAVTVVVMSAGCVWAVTGSVTPRLSAPGVLTHEEGSYVLQSPVEGQVTAVFANEGDWLPSDVPLLSVGTDQDVQTVRTVAAGRVTSLVAGIGTVVTTGAALATVDRFEYSDSPLVAMLYVPGGSGATIPAGSRVDLTVQSVPARRFGVLRGHVLTVGRVPQTRQQITGFLGNDQLGERFAAQDQPVPVMVQLDRSEGTSSGFAWSTTSGPPYAIDSPTLVSGVIHLPAQHPIDWLLP
ncbi:HlyD family efflux transporter periplasmic adaptor subunit [Kitasatospora camelliae]|uniref:HlyD family efflux transporter periplasmic adaptor subunit n=1 Tax=Kitasatospora camelliae TaxID=3156397 RepID=A0AAU8JN15_9ACTN